MTGRIYLCPPVESLVDPNPDCPGSDLHSPEPRDYVGWFEWAARMAYKGNTQSRCPGCDRYSIWSGGRP